MIHASAKHLCYIPLRRFFDIRGCHGNILDQSSYINILFSRSRSIFMVMKIIGNPEKFDALAPLNQWSFKALK